MTDPSTIESLLLARGLLKADQLERLRRRVEKEGSSLETIIAEEKLVYPEQLAQVRAEALGVPYVDLTQAEVDRAAMADISRTAAATYRFVAFGERDGALLLAMEAPDDFQALEAVKFIAKKKGLRPEVYLASKQSIAKVLGGAAEVQAEIGSALKDFGRELEATSVAGKDEQAIEKLVEEAPVTKVVAVLIRHAIDGNASDIHLEPTEQELRVRYRIDGNLHTSLLLPRAVQAAIVSRIKILANLKIDETRLPQDGRFSITTEGRAFDFRVSSMPTIYGEKIALRILDKSRGAPSFDDLGLRRPAQDIMVEKLRSPNGIILISGPTGSGKSTTLFTALTMVNAPAVNVATLEDPVEYEIKGVSQTQINPDIGLTFASGLRNILRQDPDIIMVGEIRDKDTAALAVHASLTGHLVLTTIHTNDAIGTIPRLIDMGIDPFLLTATVRLLAAQRLVGKLCQECKQPANIPASLLRGILKELEAIPGEYKTHANHKNPHVLFTSPGCPACHEAGAVGRTAIFELVPVTRALREAIGGGGEYDTLHDVARREGYVTMRQDGLLKALAGDVKYEDVVRVTTVDNV